MPCAPSWRRRPSPIAGRDPVTRQIGDYFAACMDEKGIDARGLAPLAAEFDRIAKLSDKKQLAQEIAHLHRIGVGSLFEFGSGQDFKDSTAVVAQLDQGGIGLPDRDYYLKDDPRSVELRQKYLAHVQRMFELAGRSPETAKANAATVLRIETALAKGSLDRVSRRDPEKIYHPMKKADIEKAGPDVRLGAIFQRSGGAGASRSWSCPRRNSSRPSTGRFRRSPLEDWKVYLAWHLLHSEAPLLPSALLKENFDFYGQDADRRHRNAAALEALRASSPTRSSARRWARNMWRRRSARRARSAP